MLVRVLTAVFLVAAVTPASATVESDLKAIDARLKTCIDKDSSNMGMKICTGDASVAADKLLNRLYKKVTDKLKNTPSDGIAADDKETLKRLVASERAWVAYKGVECDLQGTQMLNGSGESLVIENCIFEMTKARAKALDELFGEK